jgi:hypothetical protein
MKTVNAQIVEVSRERMIIDVSKADRAERIGICRVAGLDEASDGFLDVLTGKAENVVVNFCRRTVAANGGFERRTVETDYVKPYLERLKKATGFEMPKGSPLFLHSLREINFTHSVEEAELTDGRLFVRGIGHAYSDDPINDETRRSTASAGLLRCIEERIGVVEVPREFVEADVGRGEFFKRNPKYGTGRSERRPGAAFEPLWQELFRFWAENHATQDQKAALKRLARCKGQKEEYPTLRDYGHVYLDGYATVLKFEDFAAGRIPPVASRAETPTAVQD